MTCSLQHPEGYGPCVRPALPGHDWYLAEIPVHTENKATNTYYTTDVYPWRTASPPEPTGE